MTDIFLSYSRDDQAIARRFAEAFKRDGLSVWWDQTLKPGEAYDRVTERALQDAKAVVVLWSRKSVESHWVRSEATQAQSNGTLVPVMIEACKRPIMFELMHTAELAQWKGDPDDATWRAFAGDVRQFVGKQAQVPASEKPAVPAARRFGLKGAAIAAVALLLAAAAAIWMINRSHNGGSAPAAGAATTSPAAAGQVTLAVLPFADMSTARDQESFSDGLSEEILNQLAQIKDLLVTGRTSSFSFKGKNEDLREIAKKLGVSNLLEGSIRKNGQQLRITAQLINGTNGARTWSQTYNRELKDVFAVQEEIAKDVAQALSIKLDVGAMKRAEGGTTNIEAYDKFLRAEALSDHIGGEENLQSIQLFRESIALDPAFARAWIGLYGALEHLLINPNPVDAVGVRREMSEIGTRVVALAPDVWWTQTMLAEQYRQEHKWAENEIAVNKAVATAPPSQINVATTYVLFLWAVGRVHEAADYMVRVHQTNPLSRSDLLFLQMSLDLAGRPEEAEAANQRAKTFFPGDSNWEGLALFRLWSRKQASAAAIRAQFRRSLETGGVPAKEIDGILDKYDRPDTARADIRRRYDDSVRSNTNIPNSISQYADHFGDEDLALDALRRGLIDLRGLTFHGLWVPYETNLRTDPRFKALLRDLGLADYFRGSGKWGDFCKPVGKDDFECH
jgi:TolB-like protein